MSVAATLFAAVYDRAFERCEKAGLSERRARLLAGLSGRVLEIGAGTGLNLAHYPQGVDLVLAEPEDPMAKRLEAKGATVIRARAEGLPFPDDSFDAVVSTLVLCTVPDPPAALAEIERVLKPGGRLLFIEHVRSGTPRLARWQDRLVRPWRFACGGCHCNRDTEASIVRAGYSIEEIERGELAKFPPLARPGIQGAAVRAAVPAVP